MENLVKKKNDLFILLHFKLNHPISIGTQNYHLKLNLDNLKD